MTKAELFRIGYFEDKNEESGFDYDMFNRGLFIELKASGYINTLGRKWETEKNYKKVQLIK